MKYFTKFAYAFILFIFSFLYAYNQNIPACVGHLMAALYYILFKIEESKNK